MLVSYKIHQPKIHCSQSFNFRQFVYKMQFLITIPTVDCWRFSRNHSAWWVRYSCKGHCSSYKWLRNGIKTRHGRKQRDGCVTQIHSGAVTELKVVEMKICVHDGVVSHIITGGCKPDETFLGFC